MNLNTGLLAILLIFFLSCAEEESRTSSIPSYPVVININVILENKFDIPLHYKKYYNNTDGVNYAGYAGVIVISNYDATWLYAYDLCCPYEAPVKNELQVMSSGLKVKCPQCGSQYNIEDGTGRVESGPSSEKLKTYLVRRNGSFYEIRN